MPLKPRFLRNFITFLNSNLTNLSTTFLMDYILSFKKDMQSRVNFILFKFPYSNTKHRKYSISTFSIKRVIIAPTRSFQSNHIILND
jgi:hypothetical protein